MDRKTLTRAASAVIVIFAAVAVVFMVRGRGGKTEVEPGSGATAGMTTANTEASASSGESTAEEPPETSRETQAETSAREQTTLPDGAQPAIGSLPVPVVIAIDELNFNITLVNRKYRIPDGYQVTLAPSVQGSDVNLDYRAAVFYEAMYNAAKADGCTLTPYSGYRGYATQKANYENKVRYYTDQGYNEPEAKTLAAKIIMPPGSSEHNLGLAMDICGTDYDFDKTEEFRWLMKNAADYGFILRYTQEKQSVTQVVYEPWHWRYVGAENAKAIKASGLCLEEWLGKTAG